MPKILVVPSENDSTLKAWKELFGSLEKNKSNEKSLILENILSGVGAIPDNVHNPHLDRQVLKLLATETEKEIRKGREDEEEHILERIRLREIEYESVIKLREEQHKLENQAHEESHKLKIDAEKLRISSLEKDLLFEKEKVAALEEEKRLLKRQVEAQANVANKELKEVKNTEDELTRIEVEKKRKEEERNKEKIEEEKEARIIEMEQENLRNQERERIKKEEEGRIEREKKERERVEKERVEKERVEKERVEKERLANDNKSANNKGIFIGINDFYSAKKNKNLGDIITIIKKMNINEENIDIFFSTKVVNPTFNKRILCKWKGETFTTNFETSDSNSIATNGLTKSFAEVEKNARVDDIISLLLKMYDFIVLCKNHIEQGGNLNALEEMYCLIFYGIIYLLEFGYYAEVESIPIVDGLVPQRILFIMARGGTAPLPFNGSHATPFETAKANLIPCKYPFKKPFFHEYKLIHLDFLISGLMNVLNYSQHGSNEESIKLKEDFMKDSTPINQLYSKLLLDNLYINTAKKDTKAISMQPSDLALMGYTTIVHINGLKLLLFPKENEIKCKSVYNDTKFHAFSKQGKVDRNGTSIEMSGDSVDYFNKNGDSVLYPFAPATYDEWNSEQGKTYKNFLKNIINRFIDPNLLSNSIFIF